jgi:hypothetical protein
MQDLHDAASIRDAGVPLAVIETHEERRALSPRTTCPSSNC